MFCHGYHFEKNTFTNNFGCSQMAGGVIRFECLNDADTADYNNDRYDMPSVSVLSSYVSASTSYTTQSISATYNSVTYTGDLF